MFSAAVGNCSYLFLVVQELFYIPVEFKIENLCVGQVKTMCLLLTLSRWNNTVISKNWVSFRLFNYLFCNWFGYMSKEQPC